MPDQKPDSIFERAIELYNSGLNQRICAERCGINYGTFRNIMTGRARKHLFEKIKRK